MALLTFPTLTLAWPVDRNDKRSTQIEEAVAGQVNGYPMWLYPRTQFTLAVTVSYDNGVKDFQAARGFFNNVGGRASAWQFTDPIDNAVSAQQFALGDGATKTFQLLRDIGGGFLAPVYALNGSPTVTVNGTSTSVTVNTGGTVTFASAPANGAVLRWTGSYYLVCRFDSDEFAFSQFAANRHEIKQIQFTTEKL